ncbi:MAG: chorismate mutase, partial [Anderseniella sp.]
MDKTVGYKSELDEIRQEIDDLDSRIVDLLIARFAASDRVRQAKASGPQSASTPYRPGREAIIVRRLMELADGRVPPEVIERVWRTIISSSVLAQAPVRVIT